MSIASELILEQSSKSFDGYQYVYSHESWTMNCKMKFGIYIPSIIDEESAPLLIFLSDSNSTEQSFITKSGIQRLASKYGFIAVNPDTCPRRNHMFIEYHYRAFAGDCGIEDNGGYIDATESQWLENYQMFSYVNDEFYELIVQNFNVDIHRIGIFGHGVGGHGALISFFKRPAQYRSISAFAPIYNLSRDIFQKFLGEDEQLWNEYNLCELVESYQGSLPYAPILIDENCDNEYKDKFLQACTNASFPIQFREQIGYDHGYYFLLTFLEDHIKYHQKEFEHLI